MKAVALALISLVTFSSLPAKAWACAFNLCPMEHHQDTKSQNQHSSSSCHEVVEQADNSASADNEAGPNNFTSNEVCPCPDTLQVVSISPDSRIHFEEKTFKNLQSITTFVALARFLDSLHDFQYRPPQLIYSLRLHAVNQIYII